MNNEVVLHLEEALAQVRNLFLKAATRIEALKPGEKIPATQLADDLAKEQGQTGPQVYPTLKILLDGYPGVKILRGAHGGIHRPLPVATPVDTAEADADDGVVADETSASH
jgi:hypothetical protein